MAGTQAQRGDIVKTRSKFFAAERAARVAIEEYEKAKRAYSQACDRAGVTVYFDDDDDDDARKLEAIPTTLEPDDPRIGG